MVNDGHRRREGGECREKVDESKECKLRLGPHGLFRARLSHDMLSLGASQC